MANDEKVVVLVSPKVSHAQTEDGLVFAARIRELGLTAYGDTRDEAEKKVQRMFASKVSAHRACDSLDEWLDRSGLSWCWESEYVGRLPAIDAKTGEQSQTARTAPASATPPSNGWEEIGDALPVAA